VPDGTDLDEIRQYVKDILTDQRHSVLHNALLGAEFLCAVFQEYVFPEHSAGMTSLSHEQVPPQCTLAELSLQM